MRVTFDTFQCFIFFRLQREQQRSNPEGSPAEDNIYADAAECMYATVGSEPAVQNAHTTPCQEGEQVHVHCDTAHGLSVNPSAMSRHVSEAHKNDVYAQVDKTNRKTKGIAAVPVVSRHNIQAQIGESEQRKRETKPRDETGAAIYSVAKGDAGGDDYCEVTCGQMYSVVKRKRVSDPDDTIIMDNALYGEHI